MKRRIYHALCFVAFLALLVSTVVSLSLFYHFYEKQNQENLAVLCRTTASGLQLAQEPKKWLKEQANLDSSLRITFLDAGGQVLYDSQADDSTMENHKDRPEIQQALIRGFGEDSRLSNTLGESTYYYAVQLSESGTVLRLSRNLQNMLGTFLQVLPFEVFFSLLLFLLSLFCAQTATRRIVIPLTKAADHLEQLPLGEEYEELTPFLKKIQNQNDTIRQQLDAIREEKERVTAILSNTQEGLVLCDRSGQILSVNESALSILSPAWKDHLEGKHYVYLTRNQQLAHAMNAAEKGVSKSGMLALNGKFYRFFVNPVMGSGQVTGVLLLLLDVTQERNAQKAREDFSANVTHELKTPLTSISGFAEMLQNGMVQDPKEIRECSQMIYKESRRLLSLIDDVLRLSRLEEAVVPFEKVDLFALSKEIVSTFEAEAQKRQVTLLIAGHPAFLEGNSVILEQMVANLCENAIKYNHPGGNVSITVEPTSKGMVRFYITDTGIGIPDEHKGRVFERFYRVDKSRSKHTGGTGLGLSIVKHAVERHGGEISLQSQEGEGTTILVVLPSSHSQNRKSFFKIKYPL